MKWQKISVEIYSSGALVSPTNFYTMPSSIFQEFCHSVSSTTSYSWSSSLKVGCHGPRVRASLWFSGPEIKISWRPRVNWACAVVKIATWTSLGWRTDKHYSSSTHWPEQGGGILEYHRGKQSLHGYKRILTATILCIGSRLLRIHCLLVG